MPDITSGRINDTTGEISYTDPTGIMSPTNAADTGGAASFTPVMSVAGLNTSTGAGIYRGANGVKNIVLEFKTLVAGEGIEIIDDFTELRINSLAAIASNSFRGLSETPDTITTNGLVFGSSSSTLDFVVAPDTSDTVLTWGGEGFYWSSMPGTDITLSGGSGVSVSGSLTKGTGTFVVGLSATGVLAGSYTAASVVIDSLGRVTSAASNTLGETNSGENIGGGAAIYSNKSGTVLRFKGIVAGPGISVSSSATDITVSALSAVQRVAARGENGVNVTGSPITDSGTFIVGLGTTGVSSGTYTRPTVVVDAFGRVTSAVSGTALTAGEVTTALGYTPLSANQNITVSGDATGSGTATIALTLSNTGVLAGTYNSVVVDAKGRVTNASAQSYISGNEQIAVSGDVTGTGTTSLALSLSNTGVVPGTYNRVTVDAKGRVTAASSMSYLTANAAITISGDASGSGSDAITLTLSDTGVMPGTFNRVVVDSKGRVLAGSTEGSVGSVTLTGAVTGSGTGTIAVSLAPSGVSVGTYNTVVVDATGLVTSASNANYLSQVTLTGDATGTGIGTVTVALADTGVSAGTYNSVSVDAKGRVLSGGSLTSTNVTTALGFTPISGNQNISVSGDVTGSGSTSLALTLTSTGVAPGTYTSVVVNSTGRVTEGANPNTTLTGDVTGIGHRTINVSLANSGVIAGTYNRVTVDAKGRVTAASSMSYLQDAPTVTLAGDAIGSGTSTITVTLADSGVSPGTYTKFGVDTKGRVTVGTTLVSSDVTNALGFTPISSNQTIGLYGDVTGSGSTSLTVTLANSGVSAGTYTMSTVVVDSKGRIVSASNGSALTGITVKGTVDASGVATTLQITGSAVDVSDSAGTATVTVSAPAQYQFRVNFDSGGNIDGSTPFPSGRVPAGWSISRDSNTAFTVTHSLGRTPVIVTVLGEKSGSFTLKVPNGNPTAAFSVAVPSSASPNTFTVYGINATAVNASVSSYAIVNVLI
jgi:phage-related tail fiber protein